MGKGIVLLGDPEHPEDVVIDGGANGRSVVVFRQRETEAAVLTGFTLRNAETDYGGGIYIRGSSPTISHLIISSNEVWNTGGGIYCTIFGEEIISAPTIRDVIITNNYANDYGGGFGCYFASEPTLIGVDIIMNNSRIGGGGIFCSRYSILTMENCLILNDSSEQAGGGFYLSDSAELNLSNCRIENNFAAYYGGAIYTYEAGDISITLENCFIRGNTSDRGERFYLEDAECTIRNSIILDNEDDNVGIICSRGTLFLQNNTLKIASTRRYNEISLSNCPAIISNCIFSGERAYIHSNNDTVSLSFSDIVGGRDLIDVNDDILIWGEGNIDTDPVFRAPDSGDYRLLWGSPCINAGDPETEPDPDSSRADMELPLLGTASITWSCYQ